MMYDREKSDPATVAVKPTNKAGQPAAELVEPRAGAEGTAATCGADFGDVENVITSVPARMPDAA